MSYDLWQTCLLLPYPVLNRSECASWVQAWGSVAAIVWGVYLYRNELRGRRQQTAESRVQRLRMLLHAFRDMETSETVLLTITDRSVPSRNATGIAARRWRASRAVIEAVPLASAEDPAEYDILSEYYDSFDMMHIHFDHLQDRFDSRRTPVQLDEASRGVEAHRRRLRDLIARTERTINDRIHAAGGI